MPLIVLEARAPVTAGVSHMFNLLDFIRKERINDQIKVFLMWEKKRGMSIHSYQEWLPLFKRYSKRKDVRDITPEDLVDFLDYVRETRSGMWPIRTAEKSITKFIRFYSARGKMTGNLAQIKNLCYDENVKFISNVKRNRDLVQRRLKDPKKWSWRRLGDHYGMHFTTARKIYNRDVPKYS